MPRRGLSLNELNVIGDGAVLIRDGRIAEVGPTRRLENLAGARGAIEIDASGRVVMPGFVDSHTHLVVPCSDDDDTARRVRSSTGQRIELRTRAHLEAMARHGTTTVEAKTGCGPDESAESKLLRVLCALRRDPLDLVPSFLCRLPHAGAPVAAEWVLSELLPKIQRRKTAHFADLVCNGDPALVPVYDRYLDSARTLGFACKIHADNLRPADAVELAVRHRVTSIDHLEHATVEDARRIGAGRLMATLLPLASFQYGGARPPVRALLDAGAAVAIATNFTPQSSPTLNMQTAITLACYHLGMTIEAAIVAATINGAHSIGQAGRTGSIEPGKSADIIVANISDYRDLRHSLGTNVVHQTIKNGNVIYQEARVSPSIDETLRPTG
ncbi:MAG: amidohydrolase family protein [Acidobacteria bacterium]|nr:amidohydrolase family protein [Acidobacteriota bacterium]